MELIKKHINLLLIVLIVGLCYLYYSKPAKIEVAYPYTVPAGNKTEFACEGIAVSSVVTDTISNKKVIGETSTKNADKVAIKIDGDKLHLTTQASVQYGGSYEEPLTIVDNTNDKLTALQQYSGPAQRIEVFKMNKKNGMAVWTTTEYIGGTLSGDPDALTEIFACR